VSPRRSDKIVILGVALIAIALIAIIGIVYYITTLQPQVIVTPPPSPPQPTMYKLTLPTVFTVNDIWAGRTMDAVTITIYKYTTKETLESGVVTSGTYTTVNKLTSGDRYWVKLSKNNAFKYYDVVIPMEASPAASNHYITLDFYTVGTWPVKLFAPDGTPLTSGEAFNVTAKNNKYPSFTLMLGPPLDDTGVMDTYDPIKAIQRQTVFYIHVTGPASNKLIVQNLPILYTVSATDRYFGYAIDSSKLIRDRKPDGTYASEGIMSITLSFDASGLSPGESVSIECFVYAFTNADYFKNYGTHPEGFLKISTDFSFSIKA